MAGTWSVNQGDNLGNLAKESTDPTEGVGLFALTVGVEGQIPFCPTVRTVTVKRDEIELSLARSNLSLPYQCLFTKSC